MKDPRAAPYFYVGEALETPGIPFCNSANGHSATLDIRTNSRYSSARR